MSRIRIKLFATILAILIVFFVLITVFSSPVLFKAFSSQTYHKMFNAAQAINACQPGTVTYYFELNSIAAENNLTFEIVNADGFLMFQTLTVRRRAVVILRPRGQPLPNIRSFSRLTAISMLLIMKTLKSAEDRRQTPNISFIPASLTREKQSTFILRLPMLKTSFRFRARFIPQSAFQ